MWKMGQQTLRGSFFDTVMVQSALKTMMWRRRRGVFELLFLLLLPPFSIAEAPLLLSVVLPKHSGHLKTHNAGGFTFRVIHLELCIV